MEAATTTDPHASSMTQSARPAKAPEAPTLRSSSGDRSARYAALVDAHAIAIARYLYGVVGSQQVAEDLTQDTFLSAWKNLDRLRDPSRARSWLFAIAANAARRHLRRRGRFAWLSIDRLSGTAGRAIETQDLDPPALALERALGQLGLHDRQLVLLVGLEGFTIGEAAGLLGLSAAAAKKRWQRACARLRPMLDGGDDPSGRGSFWGRELGR